MGYLARRSEEGLDGHEPDWGAAQKGLKELGEGVTQQMNDKPGEPTGEEVRSERADAANWLRER